jgi:hypothetical protein
VQRPRMSPFFRHRYVQGGSSGQCGLDTAAQTIHPVLIVQTVPDGSICNAACAVVRGPFQTRLNWNAPRVEPDPGFWAPTGILSWALSQVSVPGIWCRLRVERCMDPFQTQNGNVSVDRSRAGMGAFQPVIRPKSRMGAFQPVFWGAFR